MFKSYRFYEVVWPPEKEVTKRIVKIDTKIECNMHCIEMQGLDKLLQ